jgi:tetratricopeptide (TPR) repeat protein/serine/threonine protein kinase
MNSSGNNRAEGPVPSANAAAAPGPDDPRVIAALEEYVAALQAGQAPDREAFQARHPEIAAVLADCLDGLEWMRGAPTGPRPAVGIAAGPGVAGVPPGTPLGDYRILREIGRGGMGVVYEAEQLSLGRRVALKVLPFASTLDSRQLQRFHNEAHAAAQLHHTNIVPVFATGCERGVHFYAMQYVPGQSLAALIGELRGRADGDPERTGPYRPEAAQTRDGDTTPGPAGVRLGERSIRSSGFIRVVARLGVQAAEALEHAHQLGIIHRDIKLGNLLVEQTPLAPGERGWGEGLRLWVADFGLAYCRSQPGLTMTGDLVGTLRYMSPEQALGKRVPADHRTDVYSLGATLYELLTLEPAFGGHDREELLRQIAFEEPRPPRRLNPAVPREVETILGKAMGKNPAERYATARELADDLERFLRDEPIRARRPTLVQRARKWARRHKTVVWAAVLLLVTIALLTGGGLWSRHHELAMITAARAARQDEANQRARDALEKVPPLIAGEKWSDVLSLVGQAEAILASSGGSADLAEQAGRLRRAAETARRLENARLQMTMGGKEGGLFDLQACDVVFAEAFAKYGLDVGNLDLDGAADMIRSSPISRQMIAALDEWAFVRWNSHIPEWERRLALARRADPHPWRNRLRDVMREGFRWDRRPLQEVIDEAPTEGWQPATALLLGRLAEFPEQGSPLHERVAALLRRVQQQHPDNFWINTQLAGLLLRSEPPRLEGAAHYFAIAVALRPQSPGAHNNLGAMLYQLGKRDEGIAEYHKARDLDPNFAAAYCNLGIALNHQGKREEAIALCQKAVELEPQVAVPHLALGNVLREQGRLDEAVGEFRTATTISPRTWQAHFNLGTALIQQEKPEEGIAELQKAIALNKNAPVNYGFLGVSLARKGRLDEAIDALRKATAFEPNSAVAHRNLGLALRDKGRPDEAIAEFRKVIAIDPKDYGGHIELAVALDRQGRLDEAITAYRKAAAIDPTQVVPHANLCEVLMTKGKQDAAFLDEAIAEGRKAVASDPRNFGAHLNLGGALRQRGRLDEAITEGRKAADIEPKNVAPHINIGQALWERGRPDEAIAEYRIALDIDPNCADAHGALGDALWLQGKVVDADAHFRRCLELLPERHPRRADTLQRAQRVRRLRDLEPRLPAVLAGKVQPANTVERLDFANLAYLKKLYAGAVRLYAEGLAAEPKLAESNRYDAACAAALGGCGKGEGGVPLDEPARARLRRQALDWLRADLALCARRLDKEPKTRAGVREQLRHWQQDADLAGVRGDALTKLPEAERRDWEKFWADVAEMLARCQGKAGAGK